MSLTQTALSSSTVREEAQRLYERGAHADALRLVEEAISEDSPADARLLGLLGNLYLKQRQPLAAADVFARLAPMAPDQRAFFLKTAATLYLRHGAREKAALVGLAAIKAGGNDSKFVFEIAELLAQLGRLEEAEPLLEHIDFAEPKQVHFAYYFLKNLKKNERAYALLKDGVTRHPGDAALNTVLFSQSRSFCDFPVMRTYEALMRQRDVVPMAKSVFHAQSMLDRLYWCDDERLQSESSVDIVAARMAAAGNPPGPRRRRPVSPAGEKLRIGYISNDFGQFVVASVIEDMLQCHDRERFDIRLFCYTAPGPKTYQEKWPDFLRHEVTDIFAKSDAEAAAAISAEKIDVLIDLKGHTSGTRLNILALADTPVTATFLGFPGTLAGVDVDYVISDPIVTPDSSRDNYAEKLCRLPEVQMPNMALAETPKTTRADWGLPEDRFVFASFNAAYKITPRTIDLWCRILHSVPDSVLWMTCSDYARANLIGEFARQEISPQRLIFMEKSNYEDYIARIALADLALDTLPYNGHSTTADILRAGLPLVTMRGQSYHSRVSWSLLNACGAADLAAHNDHDYVSLATYLATSPGELAGMRRRIEEARGDSPIFQPERMARHIERACEMMAERARQGLAPDHIDVPALP